MDTSQYIFVDGSFSDISRPFGYSLVTDAKGEDLLLKHPEATKGFEVKEMKDHDRVVIPSKFSDCEMQNNGSELIGMVVGLRIALLENSETVERGEGKELKGLKYKVLHSDSNTVISWSQGRVGKKTREKMDPRKLELVEECERLRGEFERRGGKVLKVDGDLNVADFGLHRDAKRRAQGEKTKKPTKPEPEQKPPVPRRIKIITPKKRKIVILKS